MSGWALLVAVLLLFANAFFVAVEFALVAARRTRIEPLAAEGRRSARAALAAMRDLNVQLAGSQLGITMASLGLGFVAEPAVAAVLEELIQGLFDPPEALLHTIAFVIALTIVVFLHMVIGEMVPKNIAIAGPERTLLVLALPNRVYVTVFRPLIRFLNLLANAGVRVLGAEPRDELATAHTADEFTAMLARSREEGLIEDFAHELLSGALDFGELAVGNVVVPRRDVVTVPEGVTVAEVEHVVLDTGHSRLPVIGADLDDVRGFIHAKDLLPLSSAAYGHPVPRRLIRRMLRVPGSQNLADVLLSMRVTQVHVAVVLDADGRTAGLVTIEDLLEELVGEILDESDRVAARAASGAIR